MVNVRVNSECLCGGGVHLREHCNLHRIHAAGCNCLESIDTFSRLLHRSWRRRIRRHVKLILIICFILLPNTSFHFYSRVFVCTQLLSKLLPFLKIPLKLVCQLFTNMFYEYRHCTRIIHYWSSYIQYTYSYYLKFIEVKFRHLYWRNLFLNHSTFVLE